MDISIQQIARDPVEAEAEAAAARRSEGAGCLPGRVAYRRWLALTSSPGARADEEKKVQPGEWPGCTQAQVSQHEQHLLQQRPANLTCAERIDAYYWTNSMIVLPAESGVTAIPFDVLPYLTAFSASIFSVCPRSRTRSCSAIPCGLSV